MLDVCFRATLGGHFGKVDFLVLDLHLKGKKKQISTKKHFLGIWRPRQHLIPQVGLKEPAPLLHWMVFPYPLPSQCTEGLSTTKCLDQPQVVNVSSLKPRPDKS